MLIDTHAHLFWDSYKQDLDQVVSRALETGVSIAINVGVDLTTSDIVTKFKLDKLQLYAAIAIHPEDVIKYTSNIDVSIRNDMDRLEKLVQDNTSNPTKVVALGECGLDYHFAHKPWTLSTPDQNQDDLKKYTPELIKSLQKQLFQAHIDLAKKLNLPLLIHCRDDRSNDPDNSDAWEDVLKMAGHHFGILHCYSGKMPTTQKALKTNFLISFAGNITYPKNDYLREAAKIVPLDRITLETDCPFLSPQIRRGQRNEPMSVYEVAKAVAEAKNISIEEVANQTTKNVKALFKI